MRYYFDTSALCRFYHSEVGSKEVEAIIHEPGAQHTLSWLTITEAHSAFAMKVRTGEVTTATFARLCGLLQADITSNRFQVTRVLRRHYKQAEALIGKYGPAQRLRALDALQAAISADLLRDAQIDWLVTADTHLHRIAVAEGIPVRNPLVP